LDLNPTETQRHREKEKQFEPPRRQDAKSAKKGKSKINSNRKGAKAQRDAKENQIQIRSSLRFFFAPSRLRGYSFSLRFLCVSAPLRLSLLSVSFLASLAPWRFGSF
jgi:hypothetical protein